MKLKEKKMIAILIVISVLVIGIIYVVTRKTDNKNNNENETIQNEQSNVVEEFVQNLEDGTKLNTSTKLKETKDFNGLKIGNIQLTNKNEQSVLLADVKNETTKDTDVMLVDIYLYDKDGKEIVKMDGIISPVKAGETVQLNIGISFDYANAYDFKIVKK